MTVGSISEQLILLIYASFFVPEIQRPLKLSSYSPKLITFLYDQLRVTDNYSVKR